APGNCRHAWQLSWRGQSERVSCAEEPEEAAGSGSRLVMHLSPDELVDLAEGTRSASSAPHLAKCDECRRQLNELRDVMATLQVDVPEPSPLFWDHFSARVGEAIASDAKSARSWFGLGRWSWGFAAAVSTALLVIAVSRMPRMTTERKPPAITPI